MNILLANISTLPAPQKDGAKKPQLKYQVMIPECSENTIWAYHTNESIVKCVAALNRVRKSGGINKIIALVSNKVLKSQSAHFDNMTAFSYYKQVVREKMPNAEIVQIRIENDNDSEREVSQILSDICVHIDSGSEVYIDSAGGQRTIINIIQVLTNILRYKGISNPYTLYANIQSDGKIVDTSEFSRMSLMADAFNEFMTTGKADQLQECFTDTPVDHSFRRLSDAMVKFSDNICLGYVERLDDVVTELRAAFALCRENQVKDEIESAIVQQFIPEIESKMLGDGEGVVDYSKIITWCINNNLIQQAVTLFTEKIPKYLFDKGVIVYKGEQKKEKEDYENKPKGIGANDWESYAFYTEALNRDVSGECPASNLPLVKELTEVLKESATPKSPKVKEVADTIKLFKQQFPNCSHTPPYTELEQKIDKAIQNMTAKTYPGFISTVCNQPPTCADFLGIPTESKDKNNTISKKFDAIASIEASEAIKTRCKLPNDKYTMFIDKDAAKKLYYGYLYVKALRNRINHASSDENLTKEQENKLQHYGYDFVNYDMPTVRKNICTAFRCVEGAVALTTVKPIEKVEKLFHPTNLKVGDTTTALLVGKKKVQIADHDYEVQLVVPKHLAEPRQYDEVEVEIKQISAAGKIIQVTCVGIIK